MFGSLRDRMIRASYRSRTAWSCRASTLGSAVVASPTTVVVVLVGTTTVVVVVTTTLVVVVSGNEDPAEPPSDELQLARASIAAIPPAAVRRSRIRRTLRNRPTEIHAPVVLGAIGLESRPSARQRCAASPPHRTRQHGVGHVDPQPQERRPQCLAQVVAAQRSGAASTQRAGHDELQRQHVAGLEALDRSGDERAEVIAH